MIHAFIGTKAQFIKTAPVLRELQRRGIDYNLIDSGQHGETTRKLREFFGIAIPNVCLRPDCGDITKLSQAIIWTLKILSLGLFRRGKVWNEIFQARDGVCIIHGDTLSTLLSLFLAKRVGIKVAHIEAGLRSYNYFNPFPEELIRVITMRFSDLLFAPSDWAYGNLRHMGLSRKTVHTRGNTVYDAIQFALTQNHRIDIPSKPYAILTTHRFENIRSKARMEFILETAEKVSETLNVVFVLHCPTESSLRNYGLLEDFRRICIVMPMQEYFDFLILLKNSTFIITDGGSIQEESYFLNIPCLVMRSETERKEGLGENVCLAEFSHGRVDWFLRNLPMLERQATTMDNNARPSDIIVDHLVCYTDDR